MTAATNLRKTLRNYAQFLRFVGDLYTAAAGRNKATCAPHCRDCCTGHFGITLLDALHLRRGLEKAPAPVRRMIRSKAKEQLEILEAQGVFSRRRPLIRSAVAGDAVARKSAGMPCPVLDDRCRCMLYEQRPLLCRTFGPTIRGARRAVLARGCGRITRDIPEADFPILSIYKDEETLLKAVFTLAGHKGSLRRETIIPAALVLNVRMRL